MKASTSLVLLLVTSCLGISVYGQNIAYESFAGLPVDAVLAGSGANASGWTDSGWIGGSAPHFQAIDSAPNLTYQITNGAFIDGSNRAAQLTTNPEPIPSLLLCSRSLPPQNSTVYVSFLARASAIGTGSDSIDVRFNDESTLLGRITFKPDQAQQYLQMDLPTDGSGSGGGSTLRLYASQTYFIVIRITRPTSSSFSLDAWVNPPAAIPQNSGRRMSKAVSISATFNSLALAISSTDSGGPTTTMSVDEIRIGYTWDDVVLPADMPPSPTVPNLAIEAAVKIKWQSVAGKSYQVQSSYDLATWTNFGSPITGDGTIKSIFDAADEDDQKFYRVQIQ
jgi:hypothetical protein